MIGAWMGLVGLCWLAQADFCFGFTWPAPGAWRQGQPSYLPRPHNPCGSMDDPTPNTPGRHTPTTELKLEKSHPLKPNQKWPTWWAGVGSDRIPCCAILSSWGIVAYWALVGHDAGFALMHFPKTSGFCDKHTSPRLGGSHTVVLLTWTCWDSSSKFVTGLRMQHLCRCSKLHSSFWARSGHIELASLSTDNHHLPWGLGLAVSI
jgi:hypothetical protein